MPWSQLGAPSQGPAAINSSTMRQEEEAIAPLHTPTAHPYVRISANRILAHACQTYDNWRHNGGMRVLPSSAQIVAAQALLGIRQKELARLAKIHHGTLSRLESAGWAVAPGFASTVDKVVAVL